MDGMVQIWVMLPTYNEAGNLNHVVEQILAQPLDVGVAIVDDDSPDGTGKIADALCKTYPGRVDVVHRLHERGRGTAGIAGFKRCLELGAQWIIEMDADLSHNPGDIPRLVRAGSDCDLVVGSRYMPGGQDSDRGLKRRFISWGANVYLRLILGLNLYDCSSGFKCYRRHVLERLDLDSLHAVGPEIEPESLYRVKQLGFRIREIPITFTDRQVGESKLMNTRTMFTSLIFPWRVRFSLWGRA
jgi:dolichol-phosphate mannosyltransferase